MTVVPRLLFPQSRFLVVIYLGNCFWTEKIVILVAKNERAIVLITKNKALTSWRNFVLEFRKDFDLKYQCEGAIQSLSLLVSALAIKVSQKANVETSERRQHQDKNPKYPNLGAIELTDAIALSEALHKKTKRAVPKHLRYELLSCA